MLVEPRRTGLKKELKVRRQSPERRMLGLREVRALTHLSRFSILSADQLAYAMGHHKRTAQYALTALLKAGLICYVGAYREHIDADSLRKPFRLYSLNKHGLHYGEYHGLLDPISGRNPMARRWAGQTAIDHEVHHRIGVVDLMIALWKSVETFRDLEVVYLAPDFLRDEDRKSINKDSIGKGEIIPDIVTTILNKKVGQTRTFFVEFDRGTRPMMLSQAAKRKDRDDTRKAVFDQLADYNQYFSHGDRKNGKDDPRLLYVSEDESRHRNMLHCEHFTWDKWPHIDGRVMLAPLRSLAGDFLGMNWSKPLTDEIFCLVKREA